MTSRIERIEPILTPSEKVVSYQEAVDRIKIEKEKGKKTVLVRGVFDIVHLDHINFFRTAKQLGEVLFVGAENDDTVKLNKGPGRPINPLADRLDFLSEISPIDFVFSFNEVLEYFKYLGDPEYSKYTKQYRELNPDIVALNEFDENLELRLEQIRSAHVDAAVFSRQKIHSTSKLLKLIGYE